MKPLLAALALSLATPDGGPPRVKEPATPPAKSPSRIVVNSWTQSVYEKPVWGGYQILLMPWAKADVIDAFIYPTGRERGGYAWNVYVGGKLRMTDFADTRAAAETAITAYVGPLIEERNAKYSRPKNDR